MSASASWHSLHFLRSFQEQAQHGNGSAGDRNGADRKEDLPVKERIDRPDSQKERQHDPQPFYGVREGQVPDLTEHQRVNAQKNKPRKIVVTELLLIFRYAGLLLREAERMSTAYALRAPGQKGVAFRAWGSFLGQLLLRSMDRADELYESMTLRGFEGEYPFAECGPFRARDLIWVLLWSAALLSLRLLSAAELLGRALAGA